MTTQSTGGLNLIGNLLAAQSIRNQTTDMSDSFQAYVDASGRNHTDNREGQKVSAGTAQKRVSHQDVYAAGFSENERQEAGIRMNETSDTLSVNDTSLEEDVSKEQLQELLSGIRDTIKKNLNLDDEQMDDLLAQLNLNVLQLLQPENLQNFLLQATGKEPLDLVMDSSLADLLQTISQSLDLVADTFGMDAQDVDSEQIAELLKQLSDSGEESGVQAFEVHGVGDGENHTAPVMEKPEAQKSDSSEPVNREEEYTVQEEQTGIDVTVKTQTETSDRETGRDESFRQEIANGIVNQLSQAVQDAEAVPAAFQTDVQQAEILQQLIDQIRVFQGNDIQKMEVQLYPEHLGKVQIQVAMKSGVMTAQITTETEIAKQAIESQMVQLKENFEQQNLKVDAVEVSVATSGFQSEQERQDEMKQQEERSAVRKHGLRGMSYDEEEPEEELVTERLQAQGASVEFQA